MRSLGPHWSNCANFISNKSYYQINTPEIEYGGYEATRRAQSAKIVLNFRVQFGIKATDLRGLGPHCSNYVYFTPTKFS